MKNLFIGSITALILLFAFPTLVSAQRSLLADATYAGPRYPGGPDSLRALVSRSIQQALPAPTGRLLVHFELSDGKPQKFKLVLPAEPLNAELIKAAKKAGDYLEDKMLQWQPGLPDPDIKAFKPTMALALNFPGPLANPAYAYPDKEPTFPDFVALLHDAKNVLYEQMLQNPARLAPFAHSRKGLINYIQIRVRYPAAAMRNQEQGRVYAYFEVAENGAIEHPEILGTAGEALDAEVLRVVRQLPAATAPATINNQPVRVYYDIPITFKIK